MNQNQQNLIYYKLFKQCDKGMDNVMNKNQLNQQKIWQSFRFTSLPTKIDNMTWATVDRTFLPLCSHIYHGIMDKLKNK